MIYNVALLRSSDGATIARCPSLPGCMAKGRDDREAIANLKEAITAWFWDERRVAAPAADLATAV